MFDVLMTINHVLVAVLALMFTGRYFYVIGHRNGRRSNGC